MGGDGQERSTFPCWLDQDHRFGGTKQRRHESRKTSSGTNIDEAGVRGRSVQEGQGAVQVMRDCRFGRVDDPGQIVGLVPTAQQSEVGTAPLDNGIGKSGRKQRFGQEGQPRRLVRQSPILGTTRTRKRPISKGSPW